MADSDIPILGTIVPGGSLPTVALNDYTDGTMPSASGYPGALVINTTQNELQYASGGTWNSVGGSSSGGLDSYNTVALLRAATPPSNGTRIDLLGYYAAQDGGGGQFYYDSSSTATDDGGIVIKPTSVSGAGRWLRIRDKAAINVRWFGAKGDWLTAVSPTDDIAAFEAAIAACSPAPPGATYPYPGGSGNTAWPGLDVVVPEGNYYLSRSLRIDKAIHLKGYGTVHNPKSVLRFADGISGLVFRTSTGWADAYYTGADTSANGTASDGARVSNLAIWGARFYGLSYYIWAPSTAYTVGTIIKPAGFYEFGYAYRCTQSGTSGTTQPSWAMTLPLQSPWANGGTVTDGTAKWEAIWAHAVELVQGVTIENCYIANFPGNGINLIGNASGITPSGNIWRVFNTKIVNCGGSGVYTLGNDSSAGSAVGLDCQGNWGYGVFDRSFLGNSYVGCHASENVWGHYFGNGLFSGCYAEGQDTPLVIKGRWVTGVANGCGFTNFHIVDWSPGLTLTGPTWVRPSTKIGPTSQTEGLVFYAESGTTGGTEPDWHDSYLGQTSYWYAGPGLYVDDGTVAWKCVGIGQASTGLFESDNLQGVTQSPFSIEIGRGRTKTKQRLYFGSGGDPDAIMGFCAPDLDDGDNGWQLKRGTLKWSLRYNTTLDVLQFGGTSCPQSNTRYAYAGALIFPAGYFLGNYADGTTFLHVTHGTSAPASGTWTRGDRVYNSSPSAGGYAGWICVSSGSPGTWKGFGLIEP